MTLAPTRSGQVAVIDAAGRPEVFVVGDVIVIEPVVA